MLRSNSTQTMAYTAKRWVKNLIALLFAGMPLAKNPAIGNLGVLATKKDSPFILIPSTITLGYTSPVIAISGNISKNSFFQRQKHKVLKLEHFNSL